MSKLKDANISIACYAMVSSQFAMFVNPKNRGSNFSWKNFPEEMKEHCEIHIFMYVPGGSSAENIRVKKLAAEYSYEIATILINRMEK